MRTISDIIDQISDDSTCEVAQRQESISVDFYGYQLPEDLRCYLSNYQFITLFNDAEYTLKIVGLEEFERVNRVIVGEDVEDDRNHHWFIIAKDSNTQFITIDLAKERVGKCYNSFWDRHGVIGENTVVTTSFTDLINQLYENRGAYYYWLKDNFVSMGDAYD